MKNSKVIKVLALLSPKEQNQFRRFLNSPFFIVRDKHVLPLFEYLLKNAIQKRSSRLSLEAAFSVVYGEEQFDKKKIENKCSDLVGFLEDFFAHNELKEAKFDRAYYLAQAYKRKKVEPFFFKKLEACELILEEEGKRGIWYYAQRLKVAHERYFYINAAHQSEQWDHYFRLLVGLLLKFCTLAFFRYGIEAKNRRSLRKIDFELSMLEAIKQHFAKADFRDAPLFGVYYKLLEVLDDKLIVFDEIIDTFKVQRVFEDEESQDSIATALVNHIGAKVNKGHHVYKQKLYELYDILLSLGSLQTEGFLSADHFLNIGILSADLGNEAETLRFIDKYLPQIKESAKQYCPHVLHAYLAFGRKEFDECIGFLNDSLEANKHQDVGFKEREKILRIRCYYELIKQGESYGLRDACKAFRQFLYRDTELSNDKKARHVRFIKEVNMLEKSLRKGTSGAEVTIKRLKQIEPLTCKKWLIEKYEEF